MSETKVWYITGASKGMGLALVKQLLAKGHKVAATSRAAAAFDAFKGNDHFLPLEVDLKRETSVAASVQQAVAQFGRVDVVINNAGYGLGGALEELSAAEIEENFQVNFFAVIRVVQQVLPYLRKQGAGHIINISSIAGFAPGMGWSMYCAAKFALSGLSDALANDLQPLGIRVTNVMPGWFRTNFAKADSIAYSEHKMEEYAYLREYHEKMNSMDGKQLGDPDKVADVFVALVNSAQPPADLFLGSDAFKRAEARIAQLQQQMADWKERSFSTDFGN
ncbi:SDR family NAD(P)-dependent oxidoreductase [uncultured Chitinophaga sp.]|jgi:Short-chain dehydrogenases of various substrate specificities|uniref:SDR family NAD(P)-dependent oxidoreductase n=1 Tax=uncultured Chitinophaga sp. TaxID=339340 RepID=UPI0026022642|nr:SDR family NAD(P)-dependent oxidoreductase [uncultured Chitinophaga sp.]